MSVVYETETGKSPVIIIAVLSPICLTLSPLDCGHEGPDSKRVPNSGLSSNTAFNSITVCQLHTMANVLRQQPLMKNQYITGRAEAYMHFPLDSTALSEVCRATYSWYCF